MKLLLFFMAYFALGFVWRSWTVYQHTGVNPLVLPTSDDAYGYVARAFKVVMGATLVFLTLNAMAPDVVIAQGGFARWPAPLGWVGWLLLIASTAWMLLAQAHMGASWRIGIDTKTDTPLVTHGLFAISRNPIFLSVRISLLGLCLALPHAATWCFLLAGELLMQVQVRLEEQHLRQLHGARYTDYLSRVPRWM